MKTVQSSKFIVKSWLCKVVLLLAIFNFQWSIVNSVKAQQENAAFYIYQNDGHFDGFFYDEVLKISYSVLDTLGIEHDEIVSQEIVTADSTYRIMLTAIDSVSFVQPEIRFNPKSHDVRKENMLTYLISKDEEAMTLTFSSTMPDAMRPKVGDVLYDFDLDEGFSFRVKSISVQGGNIVVECEDIESIHDIFEQFITVEEYGADDAGSVKRRRVAGCPELNVGYHARKQQEINFNLFNFSLSGHLPIYAGDDATATIDLNIASAADLKAVWNFPSTYARIVDGKKDYVGITLTLNNELSAGLTFDGKIADVFPTGLGEFGKLPLPAAAPIFVVNFGPDGMVRGEVHAKYSFSTPKFKGKVWFMLEFNDWSPSINFGHGTPPGEPEPEPEKPGDNPWGASFEFNGFMQGGMQFPLTLSTNKLLKKILDCEVGTTVYLGPKLSGAISVDLLADNTYDMFKDSKLSLSYFCADYETKAKMKAFWGSDDEVTLADGSFSLLSDIEVYLFPEFEVEVSQPKVMGFRTPLDVTVKPSRNLFMPVLVGAAVFLKGGQTDNDMIGEMFSDNKYNVTQMPKYWQFSGDWKKQDACTIRLDAYKGEYDVRPIFKIAGMKIVGSPAQTIHVKGLLPDSLIFESTGGTKCVTINGEAKDLAVNYEINYNRDGGGVFTASVEDKTITVSTSNVQHGVFPRRAQFSVTGKRYDEDTKEFVEFIDRIFCYQQTDGLYNRFKWDRSLNGTAAPMAYPIHSTRNGNVITVTGQKETELNRDLPQNGFDINLQIEILGDYGNRAEMTNVSGTIKVIGGWLSRAGRDYLTRESDVVSFKKGWITNDDNGNWGYLMFNPDNCTTLEHTVSYAKKNEETGKYEIYNEETTRSLPQSYFNLGFEDE